MNNYMIAIDLIQDRDYSLLRAALKKEGATVRIAPRAGQGSGTSVWMLRSAMSADDIMGFVKSYIEGSEPRSVARITEAMEMLH
jgi:hypothetical protein